MHAFNLFADICHARVASPSVTMGAINILKTFLLWLFYIHDATASSLIS